MTAAIADRIERARALAARFLYPQGEQEEREYLATFGHATRPDAPPYETHYGAENLFQQSQMLADIAGFYRAWGVRPAGGERADHIAVELEFYAWLLVREQQGAAEQAAIARQARAAFLRDHLARWVPEFAARLQAHGTPRFAEVAQELAAFIREEAQEAGVAPAEPGAAKVTFPAWSPQTDCMSCPFADSTEESP